MLLFLSLLYVGTRRIEAVAGLSCVEWYKKTYLPIPQALQLLRANTTVDMVDKLDKVLQQSKDLTKKIDFLTDKLARSSTSSSISTQLKGIMMMITMIMIKKKDMFYKKHSFFSLYLFYFFIY